MRVVGCDGCRAGWVAVTLDDGAVTDVRVVARLEQVLADPEVAAVAVDIPIGLLDVPREADAAARAALPGRAASVFSAPARCVVDGYVDGSLPDHASATARSVAVTGIGLSMQAWRLVPKVAEVDAVATDQRVHEVHPEVAFATLLGEVPPRKASWPGLAVRRTALGELGLALPDRFPGDLDAAPDDVVDAAVCAWVADGVARDAPLRQLPDRSTQRDGDRPVTILARHR